MRSLSVTQGVVLDPFSILASGVMRQHGGLKITGDLDCLHGEARFKQAFVNACYFAESMTVVGPIAQLIQEHTDPATHAALAWRATPTTGDNRDFFNQLKQFMAQNNLDKIPSDLIFGSMSDVDYRLHTMPDVTLGHKRNDYGSDDFQSRLFEQLFQSTWRQFRIDSRARALRPNLDQSFFTYRPESIIKGSPVSALMAVIFTFKKPVGPLAVGELTNLASWPPVVFLLPVLAPAFASIDDDDVYHSPAGAVVRNQPAMMTYQLRIPESNKVRNHTLPYGQPYRLSSVHSWGKEPDTLRSLSDVFKALWSQAAQYSAWNLRYEWDAKATSLPVGELALDPIGAGRRIRSHNRFSGRYPLHAPAMLWETGIYSVSGGSAPRLWGWEPERGESQYMDFVHRAHLFTNQLRSYRSGGGKEFLFVFPSYFQEEVSDHFLPTAITLARWMLVKHAGLEDFVDGHVVATNKPGDGGATAEELAADPELEPGVGGRSLADRLADHLGQQNMQNEGALPVHRVKTPIGFDKTGDPTVFGLAVDTTAENVMHYHEAHNGINITDENLEKMVNGVQVQGNFKFLDAFCSKSTKDLTDVFATVSKKAVSKMRAGELVDESMVVDLFDDMLD